MTSHMVIWYASSMVKTMSATQFKAECLGILDEVGAGGEVVITKRGKPVARLVPIQPVQKSTRGLWKGGRVAGDIVHFDTSQLWDAMKK
jgi:prevent-host-death family protein